MNTYVQLDWHPHWSPVKHRFKQQAWHPQIDVELHNNGTVTLNGTPLQNEREQALAYTIMGLNAHIILAEIELEKTLKELLPLQN